MSLVPARSQRIDLAALEAELPAADREAVAHLKTIEPQPVIPSLEYTEANRESIALYRHCERGQISPKMLRRMKHIDLEYLAGAPTPAELQRRYSRNLAWSIGALSGSITILSAIVGLIASG